MQTQVQIATLVAVLGYLTIAGASTSSQSRTQSTGHGRYVYSPSTSLQHTEQPFGMPAYPADAMTAPVIRYGQPLPSTIYVNHAPMYVGRPRRRYVLFPNRKKKYLRSFANYYRTPRLLTATHDLQFTSTAPTTTSASTSSSEPALISTTSATTLAPTTFMPSTSDPQTIKPEAVTSTSANQQLVDADGSSKTTVGLVSPTTVQVDVPETTVAVEQVTSPTATTTTTTSPTSSQPIQNTPTITDSPLAVPYQPSEPSMSGQSNSQTSTELDQSGNQYHNGYVFSESLEPE